MQSLDNVPCLYELVSIVGSLRDREVACSASDRQGSNFESCVWRTVSSQSSHHPQEVLLAQFSLYVHKGGLKPDSFHLYELSIPMCPKKCGLHYRKLLFHWLLCKLVRPRNKISSKTLKLVVIDTFIWCLFPHFKFKDINGSIKCEKKLLR